MGGETEKYLAARRSQGWLGRLPGWANNPPLLSLLVSEGATLGNGWAPLRVGVPRNAPLSAPLQHQSPPMLKLTLPLTWKALDELEPGT